MRWLCYQLSMLTLALLFLSQSVMAQENPADDLWDALRDDDVAGVIYTIQSGVSPNSASTTETALTYAIKRSTPEMVKALLDLGASPNQAQPVSGFTPLMVAAKHQNLEATQFLLDRHANVNQTGVFGRNPLHVAALHDSAAIVHVLLTQTDVEVNTRGMLCPLAVASRQGYVDVVSLILTEAKVAPTAKCMASAKDMANYNHHNDVLALLTAAKTVN